MANRTPNLALLLPGLGEYTNTWHTPVNNNFTVVDEAIGAINVELQDARFSLGTLAEFLAIGHNSDGTLKPTAEVQAARSSFVYGHKEGSADFDLYALNFRRDREVWRARSGRPDLRGGVAYPWSFGPNMILDGSKDAEGYPTWLGSTGANANIDGSLTPIILMIDGKIARIRTLKQVPISGGAGTYYLYADFQEDGVSTFSGTAGACGGSEGGTDAEYRYHLDSPDLTTKDVQVGDLLRYLDQGAAGDYLVDEIAPEGNPAQARIVGLFPTTASGITYDFIDPLAVTLGFDAAETPAAGRIFIGEVDFDGAAITTYRPRHFKDRFVGEWRAVDVSGTPDFEEIWNHRLGTDQLDITIQVSQANDGSEPVEELSLTQLTNGLGVNTTAGDLAVAADNGSLAYVPDNGTLGTQNAAGPDVHSHAISGTVGGALTGSVDASLSGSPASSLTGAVEPDNSVKMKASRNAIWVKNTIASAFYRDYSGIVRTTGFIRVIIAKKG